MFLTLAASLVTPSEAWSCRGDDKDKVRALAVERCKSCGGPGCGRCAHDTVQNAARCNFHGDDNREQYYHDTCGGCSGNPGPWYCVCSPGYVGSQCESLLSPYPTLSPTQFPTYYPTVSPSQTPSFRPTATPTVNPTPSPSQNPTATPSQLPTGQPSSSPSSAPSSSPTHQRTELILQCSSRGYFEVRTKPYNDHQRMLIGYGLGETCDVMMEKDPSSIYGTSTSELVSFPVMGNGSHGTFYQYDNEKKQHCFHNNIFILFENHENDYIQSISCCYDSMIDLTKDLPKIPEPIWRPPVKREGGIDVKTLVCGKVPLSTSTTKAVQRCDLNETSVVPHGTQLTFSVATTALNNKLMKLHLLKVVGAATKGVRDFLYYDALAESQTADFSLKSNDNATISWGLQALTFISKLRVTIEVVVVNSGQPNGTRTRMLLEEMDILTGDMMSLVSSKSVRKADVNGNQMVIELIAPVAEEDQPVTGSTSSSHKEPSSEMPLLVWILGSVVAAMVIAGIACYVYWSRKVDPVDTVYVKPAIADAEKGREFSDVKEDVELPLTNIYSPKTEYEL
eukprot:CAMPEP_0173139480 /NCGR_PEP_ID=MMETSP1105-20130129/4286_1 /TAXON_ID=2985 /ORGANISM="Ochromonas sp., Strain BG-1" /LENGTH=564 /DNA_ID=CAMNT_0014052225 /DNA_START=222 /DNA_END=1916 /DNA_ORIENTATION=+